METPENRPIKAPKAALSVIEGGGVTCGSCGESLGKGRGEAFFHPTEKFCSEDCGRKFHARKGRFADAA